MQDHTVQDEWEKEYMTGKFLRLGRDYYEIFTVTIALPTKEAVDYAVDLAERAHKERETLDDEEEAASAGDFPESFNSEVFQDWTFETHRNEQELRLESQDGGVDAACVFLQHLLQKFYPSDHLGFEWSHSWGGGAAIVTAKDIRMCVTCTWLRDNLPKIAGKQLNTCDSW